MTDFDEQIASSDLAYKSGPKDAVYHYHSIYDSFTWQKEYVIVYILLCAH